ncbi:MAG: ABC transporter substrate-binding protein [Rhodocyclaceae bacterium]|jgi:ABC-type branched-subunit amino acid transport system substrate-binding protein
MIQNIARFIASFVALLLSQTTIAADPGISNNSLLIGQTGVFSGPVAEPGLQYRAGAQLYFDAVNAKGGVFGRQIKLVSYDDKFNPKLAAENAKKLINEDKVFALFGIIGTGATAATIPFADKQAIPVVGSLSGSDGLRNAKFKRLFHTRASYSDEMGKMVEQLKTTGVRSIAVVYQDDAFGKAGLKSAQSAFERQGAKPVIEMPIDPGKLDALDATVAKVAKTEPAAIIMVTAGKASTAFIRAYLKTGSRPQFFGVSVLSAKALLADLGADARGIVIAQVVPSPLRSSYGISKEFLAATRNANSKDITYNSLEGYLSAKVFVEALRRAGKDLTRDKLVAALDSMDNYDLGGFVIDYSGGKRAGSSYVDLSIISKTGQFLH